MVNFAKELKYLLTTVSKKFQPLPNVEGELAERLLELYISEKKKECRLGCSVCDGGAVEDKTLAEKVAAVTLNSCEGGPKDAQATTRLDEAAAAAEGDPSGADQAEIRPVGGECKTDAQQTSRAKHLSDMCGSESACVSKVVAASEEEDWSSNVKKAAVSIIMDFMVMYRCQF